MEKQDNAKKPGKSDFQIEVLQRVKQLRLDRQFSQPKLAEILDVTNGQIGNVESSKHTQKYTLAQLSAISKEFGVSINYIFTGKDTCSQDALIDAIVKYEERK